jgi:hypothetical protein
MATKANPKEYSKLPPQPVDPIDPLKLYDYEETGAFLRLRWRQVRNRIERGELPYVDNGRRRLVLGEDIIKYIESHRVAPTPTRRRRAGSAR